MNTIHDDSFKDKYFPQTLHVLHKKLMYKDSFTAVETVYID